MAAVLVGGCWLMYEWFRPLTATEVCERLDAAKTPAAARKYVTPQMHPVLDWLAKEPGDPNDTCELTGEVEGWSPDVRVVGYRGSFFFPEEGRRVRAEGEFMLTRTGGGRNGWFGSGGWAVDDMWLTRVDGVALPKPISLVAEVARERRAAPPGRAAPADARSWWDRNGKTAGWLGVMALLAGGRWVQQRVRSR